MRSAKILVAGLGLLMFVAGCDAFGGSDHHSSNRDLSGPQVSLSETPVAVRNSFQTTHPTETITNVQAVNDANAGTTDYLVTYRATDGSSQRILYSPTGQELPRHSH